MGILRTLLERFSRNVVLARRLPADLGGLPLFVSPGSALRYWQPSLERFDPLLFETVRRFARPGQVVWDIGANMGLFAFSAAYKVGPNGRVLAVEADTWCVSLLRKSQEHQRNSHLRLTILPAAVAKEVGMAEFHIARRGRATNFLASVAGSAVTGGVRETVLVPSLCLDWLLERHRQPDLVKVDIEGAEVLALQGAGNLLATRRPVVVCEVQPKNRGCVRHIFRSYQYCLYDASTLQALNGASWMSENIVAIPAENRARFGLAS